MENEIVELHAIISGRVQGVGFRATVRFHATDLNLKGTVANLPDGNVEIYAQGSKSQLNELLDRVKKDMGLGNIDNITCEFKEPTYLHQDFSIIYSSRK